MDDRQWCTLSKKGEPPQVATVFTTHATTVGRSLSGNGQPFYDHITEFDGDQKAHELNVVSKHSIEKASVPKTLTALPQCPTSRHANAASF
jgi:hypothetical protein